MQVFDAPKVNEMKDDKKFFLGSALAIQGYLHNRIAGIFSRLFVTNKFEGFVYPSF
jgi:hypothetical protein